MLSKRTKNTIITSAITGLAIVVTVFAIVFEIEWAKRTVTACEVVFEKDTFVSCWLSGITLGLIVLYILVLRKD